MDLSVTDSNQFCVGRIWKALRLFCWFTSIHKLFLSNESSKFLNFLFLCYKLSPSTAALPLDLINHTMIQVSSCLFKGKYEIKLCPKHYFYIHYFSKFDKTSDHLLF